MPTDTPIPLTDEIFITDYTGCNGEVFQIDVNLTNPNTEVRAFGMDILFDNTMIDFNSCVAGELIDTWPFFSCSVVAPGVLRVGGFYSIGIPVGSSGIIAELTFQVNCPGCMEGNTTLLEPTNLVDEIVGFDVMDGMFTYSCVSTATPQPTYTATPTNDQIWAGAAVGCTDDILQIPVVIDNPDSGLDSFGFDLTYCTDMIEFISCDPGTLTTGWSFFDCSEIAPGQLRTGGFNLDPIAPGSLGSMAVFSFRVTCGLCMEGDQCDLLLENLVDGLGVFNPSSGLFTFTCIPTPTPQPTFTPTPTVDEVNVADVTGCAGDVIQIPISIDNPENPLEAFGLELIYDTSMLDFISCTEGDLIQHWPFFSYNELSSGRVRIGGFGLPEIPQGNQGVIAVASFLVTCSGCSEGDFSALELDNLTDSIENWTVVDGVFSYSCVTTATPTETPIPGDVLYLNDVSGCAADIIQVPVFIDNVDTEVDAFWS